MKQSPQKERPGRWHTVGPNCATPTHILPCCNNVIVGILKRKTTIRRVLLYQTTRTWHQRNTIVYDFLSQIRKWNIYELWQIPGITYQKVTYSSIQRVPNIIGKSSTSTIGWGNQLLLKWLLKCQHDYEIYLYQFLLAQRIIEKIYKGGQVWVPCFRSGAESEVSHSRKA